MPPSRLSLLDKFLPYFNCVTPPPLQLSLLVRFFLICSLLSPAATRIRTKKHWDKDVCLNFADRCLSFFKDNVDEGVRYSVKHLDPYDTITMEPIIEPIETSDGTPGGASSMGRGVGNSGGNVVGLGVA